MSAIIIHDVLESAMPSMTTVEAQPAQAYQSSYASRLKQYSNSLAAPILVTQAIPSSRTTKRGTTVINYADDAYDDDDFDDSESGASRRPTGLRSLRREDIEKKEQPYNDKVGKETDRPVDVPPIFRPWIADSLRQRKPPTVQGAHAQAQFPLNLIPIRIEYEVQPHQQDTPFPIPPRMGDPNVNLTHTAFRRPEPSPGYKIRDIFTWNLHEALFTPEDFAIAFVQDLDLPNQYAAVLEISKQIRSQLEDYAGVAMHPLFHAAPKQAQAVMTRHDAQNDAVHERSGADTPRVASGQATPLRGTRPSTPAPATPKVTAIAEPVAAADHIEPSAEDPFLNLDDTYRCIISLSLYHSSRLYQDKFEWSLLHPAGAAEVFAKQTCADMGLNGEWVLAITHAIYEAVLKLKKETCESGNLILGGGIWGRGEIDNQAVRIEEGAGWRYDDTDFGAEWEPKLEILSKEEIEKREGDRERQLRRLRRDTARFTSTTGMTPSTRQQEAEQRAGYFDMPGLGMFGDESAMGRGERNRKKRRLRSPSPSAGTPANEADDNAWGGEGGRLLDYERNSWRCTHCLVWGSAVWAVRRGPRGPKVGRSCKTTLTSSLTRGQTLCHNCGLLYERDKELPLWMKDLHKNRPKMPQGR